MEVIIYSHIDNQQKDKLLKEISQVSGQTSVMVVDLEDLFNLMKSKISAQVIIVFLISCAKVIDVKINYGKFWQILQDIRWSWQKLPLIS